MIGKWFIIKSKPTLLILENRGVGFVSGIL